MSSLLHKIKSLMEKNKYLRKTIPFLREMKIVRYIAYEQSTNSNYYRHNAIRKANETREEFKTCYEEFKLKEESYVT